MKPNIPKGKEPLKDKLPIDELFKLDEMDLYDLHDRLWYEYFTPIKPLNKADKDHIRVQLNIVGAQIKIFAETAKNPCSEVIIVQKDTTFEPDELGPSRPEMIYTETAAPLPIKGKRTSSTARLGKIGSNVHPSIKEDLMGEDEEEDLLGDSRSVNRKSKAGNHILTYVPPTKGKAQRTPRDPNKITATSIYPELAKLADKLGDDPNKISKAKPEWPRKCITDALWKWRKTK